MENLDTLMAMGVLDVIEGRYSSGAGQADQARMGRVTLLHCELTDAGAVEKLIAATRPDRIFHLAAQSFVQSSFDEPSATMRINIEAQLNVLEAIRRHDTKIRVHIAGSSEEYGMVHSENGLYVAYTPALRGIRIRPSLSAPRLWVRGGGRRSS